MKNLQKCITGAGCDIHRSRNQQTCILDSHIKLIILQSPAPIFVRHAVHLLEVFSVHQQNTTDERLIMVFRMQFRRRNMQRSVFGVVVQQLFVDRQQINVMHCNVIVFGFCVQKSDVYQRGTVESVSVHLIQDKYLMRNALIVQEAGDVRSKRQQLLETVSEWHQYC